MANDKKSLWAPWRIEFIRSEKDGRCFLCAKEIPAGHEDEFLVIAREKLVFAMLNRYPYNSGHLLISPYRHIGDVAALTAAELHALIDTAVKAKKIFTELMSPQGFNIGFNLGAAAGAGVEDHIHLHVVPRWVGDTNFMPVIGGVDVVPEALRDTAAMLGDAWEKHGE